MVAHADADAGVGGGSGVDVFPGGEGSAFPPGPPRQAAAGGGPLQGLLPPQFDRGCRRIRVAVQPLLVLEILEIYLVPAGG